ncbi:MAG: hypothetical protein C4526_04220 [Nitrospiraceae bacterium]|nr:MAG: hypothetical protein C4526_04220 [Nitrospiraceae bacterium]
MILDMRDIPYFDAFMQVSEAVSMRTQNEEVLVFVDSHEYEKCMAIKGFAEILLECKTTVKETSGYYIIQIIREPPDNLTADHQKKIEAAA